MRFERFRKSPSRKLEDRDYSYDEFRSCAVKLRHTHALTALQHAASLKEQRPLANIRVYPCDYCSGVHVTTGNNDSDYVQLEASLKKLRSITGHPNFAVKAPPDVQEKYSRLLVDIQARMVELEDRCNSLVEVSAQREVDDVGGGLVKVAHTDGESSIASDFQTVRDVEGHLTTDTDGR